MMSDTDEVDAQVAELLRLGAFFNKFQARKAVLEGKYEKCRSIAARNHVEASCIEINSKKKGASIWHCPRCKDGFLVVRENRKTGDKFYGCTNYPVCQHTERKKPEDDSMGVVDAASVWEDKNKPST